MATSAETVCPSKEPEISNGSLANTVLLCGLCQFVKIQFLLLNCCGNHLCEECSEKDSSANATVNCPFCPAEQPSKVKNEEKVEEEMSVDHGVEGGSNMMTKIKCHACSWSGFSCDYQDHLQQFHEELVCSDCHTRSSSTNLHEVHRQDTCECRYIPCPLPDCDKKVKHCEMNKHYLSEKHQKAIVECIVKYIVPKTQSLASNITHDMNQVSTDTQGNVPSLRSIDSTNAGVQRSVEYTQMHTINPPMTSNFNTPRLLSKAGDIVLSFHIDDEKIKSSFTLDSPTFRTATFGYIFQLRVCSTSQSTHRKQDYLSIYLTLYSSPYDPTLFYPFPYNLIICLCDQSGEGRNIEATIKADPNLPAFARPTGEKNDEIGVTQFCPLDYLTKTESIYYKDRIFFIRVFVDFLNTSSNMNN